MDGKEEKTSLKRVSKKYSVTVLKSEPQIIDSKLNFYVKDRNPSPRKSISDTKIFERKRSKSIRETEIDDTVTQAIKEQLSFDSVYNKLISQNVPAKDVCLEKK